MPVVREHDLTHKLFLVTLIAKGVIGLGQLSVSASLALGLFDRMPALLQRLASGELAEDPTDFVAGRVLAMLDGLPTAHSDFYAIYFAAHGLLHVAVVAMLLKGWLWAYPTGIVMLVAFIAYQMSEWMAVGGPMLLVLSAVDVLVIALTVIEWRRRVR